VSIHSDVSSAGSGIIISAAERTAIGTNTTLANSKLSLVGGTLTGTLSIDSTTPLLELTDTDNTVWGNGTGNITFRGSVGGLSVFMGELNAGLNFGIISYAPTKNIIIQANNKKITLTPTGAVSLPGTLDMNSFKITQLATPSVGADAVNKTYSDLKLPLLGGILGGSINLNSFTLYGDDAASGNLVLESNITGSKGVIVVNDNMEAKQITSTGNILIDNVVPLLSMFNTNVSYNAEIKNTDTDLTLHARDEKNKIFISHNPGIGIRFTANGVADALVINQDKTISYKPIVSNSQYYPSDTPAVVCSIYRQLTEKTNGNSTAELLLFNDTGSIGTRIIPANSLLPGTMFKIKLMGIIDTSGNTSITFRGLFAGVEYASGTATINADPQDAWVLEINIWIITTGASGTFKAHGCFIHKGDHIPLIMTTTAAVDTTQSNFIQVSSQWATQNILNTLTTQFAYIDITER
jgi:hypothetical protein